MLKLTSPEKYQQANARLHYAGVDLERLTILSVPDKARWDKGTVTLTMEGQDPQTETIIAPNVINIFTLQIPTDVIRHLAQMAGIL